MTWLIVLGVFLFLVALMIMGEPNPVEVGFPQGYKEDIDWSLGIKGYPVVNEVDIQYSEWLAANPEKVV